MDAHANTQKVCKWISGCWRISNWYYSFVFVVLYIGVLLNLLFFFQCFFTCFVCCCWWWIVRVRRGKLIFSLFCFVVIFLLQRIFCFVFFLSALMFLVFRAATFTFSYFFFAHRYYPRLCRGLCLADISFIVGQNEMASC